MWKSSTLGLGSGKRDKVSRISLKDHPNSKTTATPTSNHHHGIVNSGWSTCGLIVALLLLEKGNWGLIPLVAVDKLFSVWLLRLVMMKHNYTYGVSHQIFWAAS